MFGDRVIGNLRKELRNAMVEEFDKRFKVIQDNLNERFDDFIDKTDVLVKDFCKQEITEQVEKRFKGLSEDG